MTTTATKRKSPTDRITPEQRARIMKEVQSRKSGILIADVMSRYGRSAQAYYNWITAAKIKAKSISAKGTPITGKITTPGQSQLRCVVGVHMPSGRKVNVYLDTAANCPIVMDE